MEGQDTGSEPERRDSNARRHSGGCAANLPVRLGATAGNEEAVYAELETPTAKETEGSQSRQLPHLRDYDLYMSWAMYLGMFFFCAVRQGICNYMTASGIAGEGNRGLGAVVKAVSTFGVLGGGFWVSLSMVGERYHSQLVIIFSLWATICYAVTFTINPTISSLTILPNVFLASGVGLIWSRRRCFAMVIVFFIASLQVCLSFIIQALPLVQARLPGAAQQVLVPAIKMLYLGVAQEVVTKIWNKMYKRPCSPYALTSFLMLVLVSAETMGVVGLLAAIDSDSIWSSTAVFCATTVVTETNSRSGILVSFVFKLMGKKYRFSDAAHIFRWGKMWASYSWVCVFSSFVVPALILGLRAEDSNFTFLRWEAWVLVGIYVLQQMVIDVIYVYIQHYIRPSPNLTQTAARCLVLGTATPLFGENEHIGVDGSWSLSLAGSKEEGEFEQISLKVGPWTIPVEALLTFLLFEYTVNVWNNYVRGQFCIYGTFLPSEDGSCD